MSTETEDNGYYYSVRDPDGRGWWRKDRMGYTLIAAEAGVFHFSDFASHTFANCVLERIDLHTKDLEKDKVLKWTKKKFKTFF
jgi:hypothetical protein